MPAIDDLNRGDEITYSFGEHTQTYEALVVGVDSEDVWILSGDQTREPDRQRPSKVGVDRVDSINHRVTDSGQDQDDDRDDDEPAPESEPIAPDSAPKYLREGLGKQDPETLRDIATYADRLADYKAAEIERELEERSADVDEDDVPEEWDESDWEEAVDDTDAPASATLTTKHIDGRDYYYYQWREGSKIKSEYVAPVNPAGSDD